MTEYSVQQQKIISQYRQSKNLGYVISDDEVVSIMQKEMQRTGKVYPGFEHLAQTTSASKKEAVTTYTPSPIAPAAQNVFGSGFYQEKNKGLELEHTNKGYATMQPTLIQLFSMNFLKNILVEGNAIVSERDKEAGVMSGLVNLWQEKFNEEYSKSHVRKSLFKTQQDLQQMEKAAKGEPISTNFLGEPIYQTFEENFKSRRGVEFNAENIADCAEKSQTYAQIKTTVEMVNKTKESLEVATKGDVASQMSPEESSKAIIQAFKLAGVTSVNEINKTLADINEKYKDHPDVLKYGGDFRINKNKQGEYVIYRTDKSGYPAEATNEELRLIANEMSQRLDKTLADALGVEYSKDTPPEKMASLTQKKLKEYQDIYEESFKKAYGSRDLKILSEEYVAKQQQGVANIEMGINLLSTALMILPPVAVAARGTALGAKLGLASKASIGGKIVQGLETAQKVSAPIVMAAMTLRPTELLEQILSKNGMSSEEWEAWGIGVLQNSVYMATGMKVSQLAEQGAAMYKTKALVNTLKKAGKSTDEIISMVKANPVKFPEDIVKSFKSIDKLAKTLQVTSEAALDISSTYFLNMAMNNGDLQMQDWLSSIAFAISGGVLQKQFAPLTTEAKVQYLCDAFKDYGVTPNDAINILKTMDDISEGKIKVPSKSSKTNAKDESSAKTNQEQNANLATQQNSQNVATIDDVIITAPKPATEGQVKEPSINERIESANSREEFASLRDEIKQMAEGAEKKALQEEYLKKYNEWSQNPQRPDVKMEYKPENEASAAVQNTENENKNEAPAPAEQQPAPPKTKEEVRQPQAIEPNIGKVVTEEGYISNIDAVMKFIDFLNEVNKNYDIERLLDVCQVSPDKVSTTLIEEAIGLLKAGNEDANEVSTIITYFKNENNEIDSARIQKFHELVDSGKSTDSALLSIIKEEDKSALETAYQDIKDEIPLNRLEAIQVASLSHPKNPKIEALSKELAKALSADNKNLKLIINKMYENEELASGITEAIKAGVDENYVIAVINEFQSASKNADTQHAASIIKNKCLNAMKEKPDKAKVFTDILNYISKGDGVRAQILDTCLKYPDNWQEIVNSTKVLVNEDSQSYTESSKACNLIAELNKAEIPLEDCLKMTDIICKSSSNLNKSFSQEFTQKIVDMYNSGKIDDTTLNLINRMPDTSAKGVDVLEAIIQRKEQNRLNAKDLSNSKLMNLIYNPSEKTYYDNYSEILDFYVENKDIINSKNANDPKAEFLHDLITSHSSKTNENMRDLYSINAIIKVAKETSIDSNLLDKFISIGYVNKLAEFLEKIDSKSYEKEVSQILKLLENPFSRKYSSDILSPQLTKEKLNYILDLQKQLNDKGIDDRQILNNDFVKEVINEGKDVPEEALDKLRFYIEAELSTLKTGDYFNLDGYLNLFKVYKNSPEQIDNIESIIFNHKWHDWILPSGIMNQFSPNKEILPKQIELMNTLFEISGNSQDLTLQNTIILSIKTNSVEDINAKLEFIEENKLHTKFSKLQKIINSDTTQSELRKLFLLIQSVRHDNKDIANLIINNKFENENIDSIVLDKINDINKNFMMSIIKSKKIEEIDSLDLSRLAHKAGQSKEICEFIEKNFDIFPKNQIAQIAESLNEHNKDFALDLYTKEYPNIPDSEKVSILEYTNEDNLNLITQLCNNKETEYKGAQIKKVAYITKYYPGMTQLAETLSKDKSGKCPPEKIGDLLEAVKMLKTGLKTIHLSKKIEIFETLNSLPKSTLELCQKVDGINLEFNLTQLKTILGKKKDTVRISPEQQKQFVSNVLANNNSSTENVLRNYDFKQYGKNGLPLKYTRAEFTNNIENIIKNLTKEEQSIILEHYGLERGNAGFDGLPNNTAFEMKGASEELIAAAQKVKEEIEKFTSKNSINTGNAEVDKVLNSLISGLPEFTSFIGKEQHGTHAYSVDIHTLKVLQSAMNNPLYEKLSDKDKTILKFAALCHDFGKKGATVDTGHASASAEYTIGILDKFNFPRSISDRIIDIVDNHHWFEAYNTGTASAEDVAVRCRRPEDFLIYEILAKADFENVNDNFHILRSQGVKNQKEFDDFMAKKMEAIEEVLDKIYTKANLVFDTKFMHNGTKFPTESVKIGEERVDLKVLDLNKLKNSASLEEYGFARGVTKKNARFIVHMMNPLKNIMESVKILTGNSLNQSAWSTSLISIDNNKTYGGLQFGFIFDVDLANISEANYLNTSSGANKNIDIFKEILINKDNKVRTYVKDNLTKNLSEKGINLNNKEYAALAKYLMSKKYTSQITKDVKIGGKVIKAKALIECLEKSRDELFKGYEHSEIVPINPRIQGLIAKVNSIEECPEEFLQFAKENNLPIILMKPTKED